ncbi:MAG TPA: glucans biosynthesis glucosyltransferase MdoH [Devosiaceae bacterium]|jgi:membrane glycosyltransferase
MTSPIQVRIAALVISAAVSVFACLLFIDFAAPGGYDVLDLVRTALVLISIFWLAWGSGIGLVGVFRKHRTPQGAPALTAQHSRVAILMPIYNEEPIATFSRVAAMNASLDELGVTDRFHIAILSDTTRPEVAAEEAVWFDRLLGEPKAMGRVFYRRRTSNVGKKAGNVEDFIRRSGAAYDYALILDADSLMEGATIVEMARRMDADPKLGLLQTLPKIINARSFFGRCMQFSSNYLSPSFARGAAALQGHEGPFWGHNAMIRVGAFAASCGLPELSGKPPSGGHILSHDYVEAAMLARAGWTVRLDPDLGGSFEEGPENLIEYAKRDRRWCQGNLQHRRLLLAPGLKIWNRFTFLQGIMAYLASPIWLALLAISIISTAVPQRYYIPSWELASGLHAAWNLAIGVTVLLLLPKVMILLRGLVTGDNRKFGGFVPALLSTVVEIGYSTLLAPVMLLLQSRAVSQVLLGLDGGWPATKRSESRVDIRDAWAASWWMVVFGFATLAVVLTIAPKIVVWVIPAVAPMALAPLLIAAGSRSKAAGRKPFLFATPLEFQPSPVMETRQRILDSWMVQAELLAPNMTAELRPVSA